MRLRDNLLRLCGKNAFNHRGAQRKAQKRAEGVEKKLHSKK